MQNFVFGNPKTRPQQGDCIVWLRLRPITLPARSPSIMGSDVLEKSSISVGFVGQPEGRRSSLKVVPTEVSRLYTRSTPHLEMGRSNGKRLGSWSRARSCCPVLRLHGRGEGHASRSSQALQSMPQRTRGLLLRWVLCCYRRRTPLVIVVGSKGIQAGRSTRDRPNVSRCPTCLSACEQNWTSQSINDLRMPRA